MYILLLGLRKDRNNSVSILPKYENIYVTRSKRSCDKSREGRKKEGQEGQEGKEGK